MKTRLGDSVYTKVLLAFILVFMIVSFGLSGVRYLSSTLPNVEISINAVQQYARMMTREIGTPPDLRVAEHLTRETGVDLAILGPGVEWASSQECLDLADAHKDSGDFFQKSGLSDGDYWIVINRKPWRFIFTEFHADHQLGILVLVAGALSILAALAAGFFMIRHILKPLRKMKVVAREFGVADWKLRVNPKGNDEFAELGAAMDSMADRIEGYIRSMHDLVAAVSHELRSPLTRMKLSLEFTADESLKKSMNQEIDALGRLTSSLLEEYRLRTQPDALRKASVDLGEWLDEVTAPYRAQGMDLKALVENPGENPVAVFDRARMDMLVRNLLENTLRHAPGSGSTMRLCIDVPQAGWFTLEVEDSGPGMDPALMARIGEPFLLADQSRTGKRDSGGFGLGLAIIRAIARAHGGKAEFYGPANGGFGARLVMPRE